MPLSRSLSGVEPSELKKQVDYWQRFKAGDFGQKWNSSKLIVKEGRNAIAPLLELLNNPAIDAETHWFTIRALGHFPDPNVIEAIAAQIDSTSHYINRTAEQTTELSAFAIETLAAMGTVAVNILSQLLQNPQRRLLAAKALNQVRSSGVIPAMISVVKDDDAQVRHYAIDALGSFHDATVTPVLLAALDDPSAAVRKATVMALGRRRDLQVDYQLSQRLEPLLWDIDLAVSCQTALALGRLGVDETLDALQKVLLSEHTPLALRIDTVRALAWYCDRADSSAHLDVDQPKNTTQRAFTVLTDALKQFGSLQENETKLISSQETPQILVAIIRVLGDLRQSSMAAKATQSLIKYLQSQPSTIVLQATVMALAGLGQPQAFDALLPLLKHPAGSVPIHTIAALKRLDPDSSFERVSTYLETVPEYRDDVLGLW